MKLNGSMLVAVAMMIGSMGALGCKSSASNAQPEDSATQPAADTATPSTPAAKDESTTILAKTTVTIGQRAPAPPPERYENPGRAPSRNHVWIKGHWRQERSSFVWVNGRWSNEYAPVAPPPARFENPGRAPSARHFWVNGYHKWVNGRYIWIGGHWDTKRGSRTYVQPHYNRVDGHWKYIPGHWA